MAVARKVSPRAAVVPLDVEDFEFRQREREEAIKAAYTALLNAQKTGIEKAAEIGTKLIEQRTDMYKVRRKGFNQWMEETFTFKRAMGYLYIDVAEFLAGATEAERNEAFNEMTIRQVSEHHHHKKKQQQHHNAVDVQEAAREFTEGLYQQGDAADRVLRKHGEKVFEKWCREILHVDPKAVRKGIAAIAKIEEPRGEKPPLHLFPIPENLSNDYTNEEEDEDD